MLRYLLVALGLSISFILTVESLAEEFPARGTIDVYFSPHGGTTQAIVAVIDRAREEILVQAYSFTSAPIARALAEANRRGGRVEVILDKSQRRERYTSADFLVHSGIPTLIDDSHAISHNKIIRIDRETLVTGSFNFIWVNPRLCRGIPRV